jgi:diketogulonate reductase-like aldo/keto reductase
MERLGVPAGPESFRAILRRMRTVRLPSGETIPALGQGTWQMAEDRRAREEEIRSLRLGVELGLTLIDTAEMYADGEAEGLVGDAVDGLRDEVFLVSKVLPSNASYRGTIEACERSLERLRTDRIDLYLLHWRSRFPLAETIDAFSELQAAGKIRHWGVSNFDSVELDEVVGLPGGSAVASDQVLYNLSRRQAEVEVLPWCRDRNVPLMAYSPVDQGALLGNAVVAGIAGKHGVTSAQVALAWVLREDGVCTIPKASVQAHTRENADALELELDGDDLRVLDASFPRPQRRAPLDLY